MRSIPHRAKFTAMPSDPTSILYDHYKDTCSIISEAVKRRDRAMLFVIIAAGFFAFQTIFPSAADHAVTDYLSFKFGLTLQVDLSVIGNIVWLLVLLFTLRYFQTAVFVERQYAYLHQLEDKLNSAIGQEILTREGKSYLADYPWFSDWMWTLYTIIFPALLLFVTCMKISGEWVRVAGNGFSFGLLVNSVLFVLLLISVALYVVVLHFKKAKQPTSR